MSLHRPRKHVPDTGCAVATDVGKKAFVPYTADYFFCRHEED